MFAQLPPTYPGAHAHAQICARPPPSQAQNRNFQHPGTYFAAHPAAPPSGPAFLQPLSPAPSPSLASLYGHPSGCPPALPIPVPGSSNGSNRMLPVAPLAVSPASVAIDAAVVLSPPTKSAGSMYLLQPPSPAPSAFSVPLAPSPVPPLSPLQSQPLPSQQLSQTPCSATPPATPLDEHAPTAITHTNTRVTETSHTPATSAQQPIPAQPAAAATHAQKHLHGRTLCAAFSSRYTLQQELGAGGFGFVCSAQRQADGAHVAVKFILKTHMAHASWVADKDLGRVPLEVFVLKNIHHPNIIAFLDYFEDDAFCYLVTELHGCSWSHDSASSASQHATDAQTQTPPQSSVPTSSRPSMDLFECIERHERFSEAQARSVFQQVVSAISHLHALKLVHRDIKDENILIDEHFNIKLIDFGSASFYDPVGRRRFDRFLGTIQYAAPEILKAQKYRGPEAEIWALGCCLYVMLTGQVPFASAAQAAHRSFTRPTCQLSPSCLDLLDSMFDKCPESRATITDIASHAWLNGF